MNRFLLTATVGLGFLLAASSMSAAFARPAPSHGEPARVAPVSHDYDRRYMPPNHHHYRHPHHWYRPAPYRYHPSYHRARPDQDFRGGDRHDPHGRDHRGWR